MFKVVTVAREYGSGGGIIARMVAEQLGWNLLDGALIGAVARTAEVDTEVADRCDERVDSWWHRFNRGGLWSAAMMAGIPKDDVRFFDADTMAEYTRQVMLQAAVKGDCVIVGRGAQCVLQDHDEAFHVFIYAPWAERVERARARAQSGRDVEELIRVTDHERASYLRTYYGCDWKDPYLYHLMINAQIGTGMAVRMIVNAVQEGCYGAALTCERQHEPQLSILETMGQPRPPRGIDNGKCRYPARGWACASRQRIPLKA